MVYVYRNKESGKLELYSSRLRTLSLVELDLEYIGEIEVNRKSEEYIETILDDPRIESGDYDLISVTPEDYLLLEVIKKDAKLRQIILDYIETNVRVSKGVTTE